MNLNQLMAMYNEQEIDITLNLKTKAYYYSTCGWCMLAKTGNKSCSRCKLVEYCSKQHQKDDFPQHKDICKAISKARNLMYVKQPSSKKEYDEMRVKWKVMWKSELGRELFPYEEQMWMFPKVCKVCYKFNPLITCSTCYCVSYCSEEHMKSDLGNHSRFCPVLKLSIEFDAFLTKGKNAPSFQVEAIPSEETHLKNASKYLSYPAEADTAYIDILMGIQLSCISTIIYALESTKFIQNRISCSEELTIHMVGAGPYENSLDWTVKIEFLFHWVLNLKTVRLAFIGPEVQGNLAPMSFTGFCETCCNNEKKLYVEFEKDLYHNVVAKLPTPDLIVAFNSGLHEITEGPDTWVPTFPHLLPNNNAILCITAYYRTEMTADLEKLTKFGYKLEFYIKNQKNFYACKRPFRNWLQDVDDSPVCYNNDYVSVMKLG